MFFQVFWKINRKIEKKNNLGAPTTPEDKTICLFAGLLDNPDIPLSPQWLRSLPRKSLLSHHSQQFYVGCLSPVFPVCRRLPTESASLVWTGYSFTHHTQHSDCIGALTRLLLLIELGSLTLPGHLYLCHHPFDLVGDLVESLCADVWDCRHCSTTHLLPVLSADARAPVSPAQNVTTSQTGSLTNLGNARRERKRERNN